MEKMGAALAEFICLLCLASSFSPGHLRVDYLESLLFVTDYTIKINMTTFGTPLSPHATKVMLLGSGELGKEVLIALQRLGVETIAVDRYDHAPGQQVAHHARTITMSDPAQLKALIEKEKPHLVVPEIEAIATAMLEELEAAGTARVIPTARAARLTIDRKSTRLNSSHRNTSRMPSSA